MSRKPAVVVAGSTGAVGSRLSLRLVGAGHRVTALTRRPDHYTGPGDPVRADVAIPGGLGRSLDGHDVAVYLVHSLDRPDFAERDARAARAFAEAAAEAGVRRIVYLSGLGSDRDDLSPHLRSRREVERLLAGTGVPVSVLRASVIVGPGSLSWALIRCLATTLPVLVGRHLRVPTQPVALVDVIDDLALLVERDDLPGVHDTGGPDVMGYGEMVRRAARTLTGRPLPMVPWPVSATWLPLISDLDPVTVRHLVESLSCPTVMTADTLAPYRSRPRLSYEQAVRRAEAGEDDT